MTLEKPTEKDLQDYREQLENHGPTCPECGREGMTPWDYADPACDNFECPECLFNEQPEEGDRHDI